MKPFLEAETHRQMPFVKHTAADDAGGMKLPSILVGDFYAERMSYI